MTNFSVDESEPGVVKLLGELDAATAETLLAALAYADGQDFAIDLSGLTFVDSSGLRAMLRIRGEHHGARFVRPTATIARLLDVTGMAEILGIDPPPTP